MPCENNAVKRYACYLQTEVWYMKLGYVFMYFEMQNFFYLTIETFQL